MNQSAADYLRKQCRQWAEQTQEAYRCPVHLEPNPFCSCVDVMGRRVNGQVLFDGKWEARGNAIQAARRRYHTWADQRRPEVLERIQQFRLRIQDKKDAVARFRAWQSQWGAAGFEVVSENKVAVNKTRSIRTGGKNHGNQNGGE